MGNYEHLKRYLLHLNKVKLFLFSLIDSSRLISHESSRKNVRRNSFSYTPHLGTSQYSTA